MIIHALGGAAVSPVRATMRLTVDERLDETITLRRCALQRSVFKGSAVSFPLRYCGSARSLTGSGGTGSPSM